MEERTAGVAMVMGRALRGWQSHPDPEAALKGLTWRRVGEKPAGAPKTINQILGHVVFWQDLCLAWIAGESPPIPEDADSWPSPAGPVRPEDWEATASRFAAGLAEVEEVLAAGDLDAVIPALPDEATKLDVIQTIVSHLSYHVGQIVLIRRVLGLWPPAQESDGE